MEFLAAFVDSSRDSSGSTLCLLMAFFEGGRFDEGRAGVKSGVFQWEVFGGLRMVNSGDDGLQTEVVGIGQKRLGQSRGGRSGPSAVVRTWHWQHCKTCAKALMSVPA